jgi:hypothetical protein
MAGVEVPPLSNSITDTTVRGKVVKHAKHFLHVLSVKFRCSYANHIELAQHWVKEFSAVEQQLKAVYAALYSTAVEQRIPPLHEGKKLSKFFPARLWRFLRSLLRSIRVKLQRGPSSRRSALAKAGTLLMVKKGSPTVSSEFISSATEKHKKSLTSDFKSGKVRSLRDFRDGEIPGDLRGCLDDDIFMGALRRTIDYIFPKQKSEKDFKFVKFPSLNAGFGASKLNMGIAGKVLMNVKQVSSADSSSDFYNYGEHHYQIGERASLEAIKYHPRIGERVIHSKLDDEKFLDNLIDCSSRRSEESKCRGKVAFIREAMKVRPILAGPPTEYFLLSQIQPTLWGCLKRCPQTYLVNFELTESYIKEFISRYKHLEGMKFHSGDYESATDNFRSCFSEYAWRRICMNLRFSDAILNDGIRCLTRHHIFYGGYNHNGIPISPITLEQSNGQSMGSPISFPILCAINHAICSLAWEADWSLSDIKLCNRPHSINGDDCLSLFNKRQNEAWDYWAKVSGSASSVGKTYYSDKFLQINSRIFDCEGSECCYLNFGLLKSKSGRGSEPRHWSACGSLCKEWLRGQPESKKQMLVTEFIRSCKLLREVPRGISWWLPPELGGLGLPWTYWEEPDISFRQMEVAVYKIVNKDYSNFCKVDQPEIVDEVMRKVSKYSYEVDENDVDPEASKLPNYEKFDRVNMLGALLSHVHCVNYNGVSNPYATAGTDFKSRPNPSSRFLMGKFFSTWKRSRGYMLRGWDSQSLRNFKAPQTRISQSVFDHFSNSKSRALELYHRLIDDVDKYNLNFNEASAIFKSSFHHEQIDHVKVPTKLFQFGLGLEHEYAREDSSLEVVEVDSTLSVDCSAGSPSVPRTFSCFNYLTSKAFSSRPPGYK